MLNPVDFTVTLYAAEEPKPIEASVPFKPVTKTGADATGVGGAGVGVGDALELQ